MTHFSSGMRRIRPGLLLLAALAAGCNDPFTVEDAVGAWDLERLNATEITGTTPKGVTVRSDGGSDSTVTVLRSFRLTFGAGSTCSWTLDDGISGPVTQNDCEYAVASDGTVSLELVDLFGADRSVTGTGRAGVLTLTDQDGNLYELRKATL